MLGHAIGDLDLPDDSSSEKLTLLRQPTTECDRLTQPVLRTPTRLLKDGIVLLPNDGRSVDQNAPALLGWPIPVLDIHPDVKDCPGKGLAHRKGKRHAGPFTRSKVCQN